MSLRKDRAAVCSDEEMDRRIAELAARAGIARGEMVVRRIKPEASSAGFTEARDAVLRVIRKKPSVGSMIVRESGLNGALVAGVLRSLADEGLIVELGLRRQARGPRQRVWGVAGRDER